RDGGRDGRPVRRDQRTVFCDGRLLRTLAEGIRLQFESGVVSLAWSTDNQKLAVACEDATLSVYGPVVPPATAEPGVSLYLHEQIRTETPLLTLEFTDSNQQLLGTQSTGVVTQWKTAQPTALRQLNHGGAVYAVAIAADGTTIVSGSADQTVRIWDAITGQQRFQMRGHVGAVHSLAVSPDGALVLTSGADRTIRLWDAVGGRQLKQLATTSETMYSVAIHPDGQIAAAAGADRQVHLYQLLTGAEIRTLNGHTDYIHSIRFSPDGKRLMSYGYAGQLRIWNVADGKELFSDRIGQVGNYASYAFDGSRALLSNGDGSARIFELPGTVR
ncbi:MAG: WD40 repeat domain-containing protein, partial [Planctomycetaceae bacterium]